MDSSVEERLRMALRMQIPEYIPFHTEKCRGCGLTHLVMDHTEQREYLKCHRCRFPLCSLPENVDAIIGKVTWVVLSRRGI